MKIGINKSLFFAMVFFLIDQSLLPMFHFMEFPFKPSYFILVFLFIITYSQKNSDEEKRFWIMVSPIIGIVLMGLIGQLYLSSLGNIEDPFIAVRKIVTYLFMVLAFGVGQRLPQFPARAILYCFYGAIATLLILSVFHEHFPWLADLWWKSSENISERLTQAEVRPTPFGDGSMVMAGILFLFVSIFYKLNFLKISIFHIVISSNLAILTAFILSSRNQMVAIIIISFSFFIGKISNLRKNIMVLLFMSIFAIAGYFILNEYFRDNYKFIDYGFHTFEKLLDTFSNLGAATELSEDSAMRPLVRFQRFYDRFVQSPLFGTGFSTLAFYPFSRLNFHNDWFSVWAASGTIGGILLFLWMYRIYKYLGILILLPFFLPGLTNSFLDHVSGVIVYCFLVGVLIEKVQKEKKINSSITFLKLSQWNPIQTGSF